MRRGRADASWWWRWGFWATLLLALIAAPVLAYAGVQVILGSSEGRLIRTIDDPAAPGWQAIAEPTPTLALALVDDDGQLTSVSVLVLIGEGRGAIVDVDARTIGSGAHSQTTLAEAYTSGGAPQLQPVLESALGVSVGAVEVVEPREWRDLVAPVGPLHLRNPSLELAASAIGRHLQPIEGEPSSAGTARRLSFWEAWLRAVSEGLDRPDVLPGELDVGLGRFVRALAVDDVVVERLPVSEATVQGAPVLQPQVEAVAALVRRIVPFPVGPEGTRLRVAVLDGTGRLDHGASAAVVLGGAGAQVDKVGNHTDFDVRTTQLVFHDEAQRAAVERLREELGVGQLVLIEQPGATVNVTIVLGTDYLEGVGGG